VELFAAHDVGFTWISFHICSQDPISNFFLDLRRDPFHILVARHVYYFHTTCILEPKIDADMAIRICVGPCVVDKQGGLQQVLVTYHCLLEGLTLF